MYRLVLLFMIVMLFGCDEDSNPFTADTPEERFKSSHLVVTNMSATDVSDDQDNLLKINGTVQNKGMDNFYNVGILITLYDKDENYIDGETIFPDSYLLLPEDTSSFFNDIIEVDGPVSLVALVKAIPQCSYGDGKVYNYDMQVK